MKIALALRHYHKKGGISRSNSHLAEGLVKKGQEVHVFAHTAEGLLPEMVFHPVPMATYPPFWERLSFARNAGRLIGLEKFDIVNNQGGASLYQQDVITAHSCHRAWVEIKKHQEEYWRYLFNPLHHVILNIEKTAMKPNNFRHIIAVSSGVAREIIKYHRVPPEQITTIPNGVDIERFHPDKKLKARQLILEKHNLAADSIILLFTGREFRRKGLVYAIETLAILKEPRLKLLVCGSDSPQAYEKVAQQLGITSQVIFAGRIDAVELYYGASDIFIFPTLYEAFSLAILEAAASGLAIVSTKVNGTEELIVDGKNGFFCLRNAFSLAEKIKILINNPALRQELGTNARAIVEHNYTWDNHIEQTLTLYQHLLETKQREKSNS